MPSTHIWSFGDGGGISTANAVTSHFYTTQGPFDIKEVVTDNIGCKDSLTRTAYVNAHKPTAAFSTISQGHCGADTVTFTNTSLGNQLTY